MANSGNARQLRHFLRREASSGGFSRGIRIRRGDNGALPADASLFEIVADFERRTILEYLDRFNWSQTETSEALRVPLSTLNQKIKRLNIDVKRRGEKPPN